MPSDMSAGHFFTGYKPRCRVMKKERRAGRKRARLLFLTLQAGYVYLWRMPRIIFIGLAFIVVAIFIILRVCSNCFNSLLTS